MTMTPDAKRALSTTIRALRERLLTDLHAATESAYRLSVRIRDAALPEAKRVRRARLEAWIDEQVRADQAKNKKGARSAEDFRREVEKQAAYTLLNRIVILRLMEAAELRSPPVVTGGWESRAYKDFRQLAPALVQEDETEGYAFLLQLVFEDLATDLPGIFGQAGVAELVPIPAGTLRHLVDAMDNDDLASCWTDDMTLGWVYQYWNDPEREALDDKLNKGGKVEPHEIASKTQMFTERYMVDWLLQNSLGPMWLAMCRKHGWTAGVEQHHVEGKSFIDRLDERRAEWRAKREVGEVSLTELMPLESNAERRWAYYVPQPIPEDAVEHAPETVRELKILDPAVGSGHFLVVAFERLVPLYREEAQHRGVEGQPEWTDKAIVECILEHNLHGIDLDPRAVQIAAAALWLKAQQTCPEARPRTLNLVASNLRLAALPDDDPARAELRREVERETGIPAALTNKVVRALEGADHLGSLLKVDAAVDAALREHDIELSKAGQPNQGDLFGGYAPEQQRIPIEPDEARESVLVRLEQFLARHTSGDDLGLRLRGEQLAAGVRFVRMMREGTYDLVVGNPPYQGTTKMVDAGYAKKHYPRGKADLYAVFLERGLQLVRDGGTSALLTMRNWMFIKQYSELRQWLLVTYDLRALGDFAIGAFDEVPNDVLSVVVSVFRKVDSDAVQSVALQPTPPDDRSYDRERTWRKRAAVLCGVGRHEFKPAALRVIPEWPLVYWWSTGLLHRYSEARKLQQVSPARTGMATQDNTRFLRHGWEVESQSLFMQTDDGPPPPRLAWVPYVKGAAGREWMEPLDDVVHWIWNGIELRVWIEDYRVRIPGQYIKNESYYFHRGVAFSMIGSRFSARQHRFSGIFGAKGSSVFGPDRRQLTCLLNSAVAREILESLNPGIGFEVGDVNRLPLLPVEAASRIVVLVEAAFSEHESHREPSVEFKRPGPSPWRHAQEWAQAAVDRPEGDPLPPCEPKFDPEPPTDHVSLALGVALGRFSPNGEGILDPTKADLSHALPAGVCFLDGTLDAHDYRDSLGQPVAKLLHEAWATHGPAIDTKADLRTYLRLKFFIEVHKGMYENRPIHWPLSSAKKTFVAWVNIHRFNADTLRVLLADHLHPTLARIEGEIEDLRAARDSADKKAARAAEKRFDAVKKARDELASFIEAVEQCTEKGPPPTDSKCPARAVDARYDPDLDDGVMVNSAALWPLLEPQWKDPKKWWKELAGAKGKKNYDWSHLAMRYWPDRVDKKCQEDPSLGVAHGCFWKYHPARAWAWELRLQDEIGPDFRIDEAPYRGDGGSDAHRAAYLEASPEEALQAIEKEVLRRKRKQKTSQESLAVLEAGFWAAVPELCWDLELRIIEKQSADFHLQATDEPTARAAFEAERPERVKARQHLLLKVQPKQELFADNADDSADGHSEAENGEDDAS
jgi:Eco57I restriction-modification methylase